MNLARFAINNQVFVLFLAVSLLTIGLVRFLTMPRREDPELNIRTAVVTTQWPGATASDVEDLVTDPIETKIKALDGVDEIRSESRNGQSIIYVDLDESTPGEEVAQSWDELRAKVAECERDLPSGTRKPVVNSDFGDVYDVVLTVYQTNTSKGDARAYTYRELEIFAETIRDRLKNLESVGRVDLFGVQDERITVEVDAQTWAKLELTPDDLASLLEARNIVASGGQVDTGASLFNIKPTGEFGSVDEIGDVYVDATEEGLPVRLHDLPIDIVRGYVDPPAPHILHRTPEHRGNPCLALGVSLKSGHNIVVMGEEVQAQLDRMRSGILPPDLAIDRINDLPVQVDTLVNDFVANLIQAILLVLAVATLMMGWRPALIMAASIPLCIITSILAVSFMGVELEQFSIASLIIALGMLVDNAIVVSDNILSEKEKSHTEDRGQRRTDAVRGASGLAIPILTATLTTVAAFLPMLTLEGNSGEYVRSLPIVVSVTLLTSYLVAMTITPILCAWLLRNPEKSRPSSPGILSRIFRRKRGAISASRSRDPLGARIYGSAISWTLRHRKTTLLASLAAIIGSFQLIPLIGTEFFPGGDRDQIWVHVWLPEGASITATREKAEQVLDILEEASLDSAGHHRLRSATAFIGHGGPRLNLVSSPEQRLPNYALVLVRTTDPLISTALAKDIARRTRLIPGARVDVRPFKLGPYIKQPVEFRLSGNDHTLLRQKGREILEVLRSSPDTVNPQTNWYNDGYVSEIRVDSDKANLARVTNLSVAQTMNALISGELLTTYREGDHTVPVVLRIRQGDRQRILDSIGDVHVEGPSGKVPLDSIAKVVSRWEPACIARRDTIRTISVGCQIREGALANRVSASLLPRVREIVDELGPGYGLEVGGEPEQTSESQASMAGAFQISAFLILLVLITQYNSLIKPLIVLATVPLALIGALLGLLTTGWAIGFMPSLGIISLAGVVINNAIILIDFIETNRKDGQPLGDAVSNAGLLRMRPILLTTLTTIGGLLPLALLAGPMWAGMAWAMIFGLGLSTLLTLIVIPTLYAYCADKFGVQPR